MGFIWLISVLYSKSHAVEQFIIYRAITCSYRFQSSIQRVMPWNFLLLFCQVYPLFLFQSSIQRVMPWNCNRSCLLLSFNSDFSPLFKESCRGTKKISTSAGVIISFQSSIQRVMPWNEGFPQQIYGKDFNFSPLFKESCRGTFLITEYFYDTANISVLYSKSHAVELQVDSDSITIKLEFQSSIQRVMPWN